MFSGVIWGGLVSGLGLAVLSQSAGTVELSALSAPPAAEEQAPLSAAQGSDAPAVEMAQNPENSQAAPQDQRDEAPDADVTSADALRPPTAGEGGALETSPGADDPVLPMPEANAPSATGADEAPVAGAPAATPRDSAPQVSAQIARPIAPSLGEEQGAVVLGQGAEAAPGAAPAKVPAQTEEAMPEAGTDPQPSENAQAGDPEAETPSLMEKPGAIGTAPAALGTKSEGLGNLAQNVKTGRLASIGADPQTGANAAGAPSADGDAPQSDKAIERYARPFENPEARPLMAIVLIDDGSKLLSESELKNLPFAVSFAIEATRADAADTAAYYRAAGLEVLSIAALPEGAQPSDVAVSIEQAIGAVPEAVAIMDVPAAAFQSGSAVATQVVASAGPSGLGVLSYARGLNSAEQIARRGGVPAAIVSQIFDGEGRDSAAMKRYLDSAAFRAAQQAGVVVVGSTSPQALAALAEWRLGKRAASVALAPVSAVLLAE
ncbi:MAG: divergent polysaccharide deacetylase family protein [Paracoccaceae bacterium]